MKNVNLPRIEDLDLDKFTVQELKKLKDMYESYYHMEEMEACEQSLCEFIKQAWHVLEPSQPYIHGWHMEVLCDHLEACTDGEITRLLINIPPGTMKSLATSVFWPAWMWGPKKMPHIRFIGCSHSEGLATRDNLKMKRLIQSEWFQKRWPVELTGDQSTKQNFENIHTGWRQSSPVTAMTGKRANFVVWDDPHSVEDAHSPALLETANRVFRETLPTRVVDPEKSVIVIVMQRLNAKDVAGEIISSGLGYEQLVIPMEYEGPRKPTKIGWVDPRRTPDELLFPARFPRLVVDRDKKIMGEYATAGQFQQRPSPLGGGILQAKHFQLWPAERDLPDLFWIVQSWDTAYSEKQTADESACTVWGVWELPGGKRQAILLDADAGRWSYPNLKRKILDDWTASYGGVKNNQLKPSRKPDVILVECKASGQSILQDLRESNIPAIEFNPGRSDKVSRAHMAAPLLEAGNFWIMESKRDKGQPISWARKFLEQLQTFPAGSNDDMVDCFVQAAIYLRQSGQLDTEAAPDEPPEVMDYHSQKKRLVNPYG